jgi:hypothetical protein
MSAVMVTVTKGGRKYHKSNCEALRRGQNLNNPDLEGLSINHWTRRQVELTQACNWGYFPCLVCKPVNTLRIVKDWL